MVHDNGMVSTCGVLTYLVCFVVCTYSVKTWLVLSAPNAPNFAVVATDGRLWLWDVDFWTAVGVTTIVFVAAWVLKMLCVGGELVAKRTATNACLCVCPCVADYIEHPNDRMAREMREERRRREAGSRTPGVAAGAAGASSVDWGALAAAATEAARVVTGAPPKATRSERNYAYTQV